MKSIFFAFMFFNFSSLNYDYELIDFSTSKTDTQEKLLKLINKTKEELKDFSCNADNRYSLFTTNNAPNTKADSLKVRSISKKLFTYKNKRLYFNNKTYTPRRRDTFLKVFLKSIKKIESTSVGAILVKELSTYKDNFVIKRGWSHFEPNFENERKMWHLNEAGFAFVLDEQRLRFGDKTPLKKIGAGGIIFWDTKMDASFVETDYIKRKIKPELVLAHEMYHAYDSARGLLDRRHVKSDELEFIEVTEYRALYFENLFRAELGLKYRRYYGQVQDFSQPDVLNSDDSPIFLPSPCVNWL